MARLFSLKALLACLAAAALPGPAKAWLADIPLAITLTFGSSSADPAFADYRFEARGHATLEYSGYGFGSCIMDSETMEQQCSYSYNSHYAISAMTLSGDDPLFGPFLLDIRGGAAGANVSSTDYVPETGLYHGGLVFSPTLEFLEHELVLASEDILNIPVAFHPDYDDHLSLFAVGGTDFLSEDVLFLSDSGDAYSLRSLGLTIGAPRPVNAPTVFGLFLTAFAFGCALRLRRASPHTA